jgi:hypothetical protein
MEYAMIGTLDERLDLWLHQERFKIGVSTKLLWDEELISPTEWIPRVINRVASNIVVGLFRPTLLVPAQTFYAHVDHSDIAGHIALADSMLKEQGTSMLLEMATSRVQLGVWRQFGSPRRVGLSCCGGPQPVPEREISSCPLTENHHERCQERAWRTSTADRCRFIEIYIRRNEHAKPVGGRNPSRWR